MKEWNLVHLMDNIFDFFFIRRKEIKQITASGVFPVKVFLTSALK